MLNFTNLIEQHWYYQQNFLLSLILYPLSLIYYLTISLRKLLFKLKIFKTIKFNIPVVIIGNISVGGVGKTPLTKAIALELMEQGYKVGIVLRGYKSNAKIAQLINPNSTPQEVGDEALIYFNAQIPVAIGSSRVKAVACLISNYPNLDLILADDGLQHYYLARDYEICVIEEMRALGNLNLLPNGPLREPISRLHTVNAIIINGSLNEQLIKLLPTNIPTYSASLELINFYNPVSREVKNIAQINELNPGALAGIGNPKRFFNFLIQLGINLNWEKSFPDHYYYQISDIPTNYAIITTEKDYPKLKKFNLANLWICNVNAKLNNTHLIKNLINLIGKHHGP